MTSKAIGSKLSVFLTALIFLASSTLGYGASSLDAPQNKVDELMTLIEKQSRQLEEQQQAIKAQDRRFRDYQQKMETLLEELQSRISAPGASTPSPKQKVKAPATSTTKRPPVPEYSATQHKTDDEEKPSPKTAGPIQPVGQPPKPPKDSRPPEVAAIFDQPGVLTPKGALILEPSLQYTNSSSKQIFLNGYTIIPAITIGLIDVESVTRDTYIAALSTRYGLTNRLELELKVPYVYRDAEYSTSPYATDTNIEDSRITGHDLGDIEFGLRYQLNRPRRGPFYIAGLRIKSDTGSSPFEFSTDPDTQMSTELPTGSGFWGVETSLSAIFASDPVVFFGSIKYFWNIERDVEIADENYEIDPGDAYGFNFGMGLSLNERASFSVGYDHSIISKSKQDGETMPYQTTLHVGSLQLGYAYRLTEKSNLNLALSVGVTENAPDVQLTLKMPTTMNK